ncbi:MAG TPA: YciI family protein [Thermoanaerobaculia bacterium]
MRFLSIYKAPETNVPPTTEEMAKMGKLIEEMTNAGVLLATEGCLPSAKGARVRRSGGKLTVTDGPFTESKELIAGFALLNAKSKEEAIELTKRFLEVAGEGECEVRQIFEAQDFGSEFTPELREQEERSRAKMAENR